MGRTFVEKIFNASAGSIVFKKPDIVLSHDNTAAIGKIFEKMGGGIIQYPERLLFVLDHNAPPTTSKLANDYQAIRDLARQQGIVRFCDIGCGICHQIMSHYAKPGMVVVGSDSHTCTAGAFNAFAAGIDRTETAGIWKSGETWFRVPETIKITLHGSLSSPVAAKDLALWIIGMLGADGANYMSVEYHGDGVGMLPISKRMTLANMAAEMGAKNAVFPPDEMLMNFFWTFHDGVWADPDARYAREIEIDLSKIAPVVACPHQVDNVKLASEVAGTEIHQAVIGTCTNGRFDDLKIAADILNGETIPSNVQLLVIPASRGVYLRALREGVIQKLITARANILPPSCGPCLGTGQGIPADGHNVISTANRNFLGRMGNKKANIYLASPATVAASALYGRIVDLGRGSEHKAFPYSRKPHQTIEITADDDRYTGGVWNYGDIDDLNTDQMFSGSLAYEISSAEPDKIIPHLFKGFDTSFARRVQWGDIIIAGENFGCGSSREHPSVGLAHAGVKAVIVKSVARIFFRSAINQGLPILVLPEAVNAYQAGDRVYIDLERGSVLIGHKEFKFLPLPSKLMDILEYGLVAWMKMNQ